MNVVVLGANGRVGSRVVSELLARGHTVTAGVHKNRDNVPAGATIIPVDINDTASINKLLRGADAVVCALSSWSSPNSNVLSTAMRGVIPAMHVASITRIVSISGDIARLPAEKPPLLIRLFHALKIGFIRKVVDDSETHLRQLSESSLAWTVIRPGIMTSSKNSNYILKPKHPLGLFIPRAAVVTSIVDLVESNSHLRQAPFIVSK